jgi:hypothetical protein
MPDAHGIAVALVKFGRDRLRGCTACHVASQLVTAKSSFSSAKNWSVP